MANHNDQAEYESSVERQVEALKQLILTEFPPYKYNGQVTPVDGEWTPELDEEEDLYNALNARDWVGVPRDTVISIPNGLLLLTDEAFYAFLLAWLTYSLDAMNGESLVREMLIYTLGGRGGDYSTGSIIHRLAGLGNRKNVVRAVVAFLSVADRDPYNRNSAEIALQFIHSVPSLTDQRSVALE